MILNKWLCTKSVICNKSQWIDLKPRFLRSTNFILISFIFSYIYFRFSLYVILFTQFIKSSVNHSNFEPP